MVLMVEPSAQALIAPLRHGRARPLLVSFWTAELADGMISIIVPIAVYLVTQDVGALALVFLGRLVLGIALASLGGYVADRFQRKYLLLASYGARLVAGAAALAYQDSPILFALLGTVLGGLGAFDNPAAEASVRSVYRDDLQAIAVMRKMGRTISQMVGPAIGGLLVSTNGPAGALWASIILILAATVILVPVPRLPIGGVALPTTTSEPPATLPVERSTALLVPVMVATFASSFLVGVVIATGVPHLADDAAAPEGAYGYALACYGLGAVIGAWVAGLIPWRDRDLPAVIAISAAVYGLIAALGVAGPWWMLLISWFLWGVSFGPEDVLGDRYLAARTPDSRLARLYARWSNVGRVGAAVAYLTMYVLGQQDPSRLTLTVAIGFSVTTPGLLMGSVWLSGRGRPDRAR